MMHRMHIDTAVALYPKHDYRGRDYKSGITFLKCSSGCKVLPGIQRVLGGGNVCVCVCERERTFEGLPIITA